MKFDMTLPEPGSALADPITSEQIESAEFRFWVEEVYGEGKVTMYHRVLGTWSEEPLIRSLGFPPSEAATTLNMVWSSAQQFYRVDITDGVKEWVDDPGANNGLFFFAPTGRGMRIASRENTDASHRPVINVLMKSGASYMLGTCEGAFCSYCDAGWTPVNEVMAGGATQRIGLCRREAPVP